MLCHVGSFIFCQTRNAFSRHSSSHSGSFFFAEIIRTTSSLRPFGISSASMSVTNPYLYSRVASSSMVSVDVDIGSGQTLNDSPQPHELFALGLLNMKPRLMRLVS